jgi:hypothetical protein
LAPIPKYIPSLLSARPENPALDEAPKSVLLTIVAAARDTVPDSST